MRDKFLTNEYFDCRIKEEGEIFSLLENGGCRDQSMLAESMLVSCPSCPPISPPTFQPFF